MPARARMNPVFIVRFAGEIGPVNGKRRETKTKKNEESSYAL
jgi:hypothetical protein